MQNVKIIKQKLINGQQHWEVIWEAEHALFDRNNKSLNSSDLLAHQIAQGEISFVDYNVNLNRITKN